MCVWLLVCVVLRQGPVHASAALLRDDGDDKDPEGGLPHPLLLPRVPGALPRAAEHGDLRPQDRQSTFFTQGYNTTS